MPCPDDPIALLQSLGAPARLVTHALLVGEAGALLLDHLARLGVGLDAGLACAGFALHDAGKAVYSAELDQHGTAHEAAGEALLLARGVDPRVARMCRTHAQWATIAGCTLEDLVVALADTLWKGRRDTDLEARVIDAVAAQLGRSRWDVFVPLDDAFEAVAEDGAGRLGRSG